MPAASKKGGTWPSLIPSARFVELPGEDHLPFVGDQDALLDEIERFLSGLRARRSNRSGCWRRSCVRRGVGGCERWRLARPDRSDMIVRTRRRDSAADWSRGMAIACSLCSTVRRGRFAVDAKSVWPRVNRACHFASGCTPASAISRPGGAGLVAEIGARVASLGRQEEVLVSRTVVDLVAGSGLRFTDRGMHRLTGDAAEWRVFAVDVGKEERLASMHKSATR